MRIRSIKPEFWTSEDIAALDWPTRLLFIGLWSYVDDNGVGRDVDKLIVADLFPLEDDPRETLATVSRGLQALCRNGQITRFETDGKPFLYINAWGDHQRIDKPNKARYPLPTCGNAIIRDTLATPSGDSRDTVAPGTGEQRNRGTGEGNPLLDKSSESDRFEEFWNTYDHKVSRKKAGIAYMAALKKPGVTEQLLIDAAAAYVSSVKADGKHPQYTKHPTTWLHGECWRDERPQAMTRIQQHMALANQLALEQHTNGELQ